MVLLPGGGEDTNSHSRKESSFHDYSVLDTPQGLLAGRQSSVIAAKEERHTRLYRKCSRPARLTK
ncbi:hypothetical protein E2C01_031266 [Portunus trituberculatus]|uniref:Uncharacterized protein n=1 Tax=Portunus trituberculatus TaxID=210409 RepID=A0A5B7EWE5_PORTR|nr:hypothetical protein [Portunus trituberculatus]